MSKSKIITTIVGLVVSIAAIWFALRAIELSDLWEALASVHWLWGIPCLVVAYLSFILRTMRWQLLLLPYRRIGIRPLFGPLMVGFGFNSILPARIGEFARPLALMKTEKVPFTTGFSTVFVERILDIVVLLALVVVTPFLIDTTNTDISFTFGEREISQAFIFDAAKGLSVLAVLLLVACALMLFPWFRSFCEAVIHRLPLLSTPLKEKLAAIFHGFARGFEALSKPKLLVLALFYSALVWIVTAWSFQLMSHGFPNVDINLREALFFTMVTCVAITIPAAPGYWGLYELGGKLALVLAGVVANTSAGMAAALGFTLVVHFIHWTLTTVVGLWYAGKIHISPSEATETTVDEGPPPAAA